MRVPIIAGNWKMNMTVSEGLQLVKGIHFGLKDPGNVDVVVGPVATAIYPIAQFLKDSYIGVAAQNLHWKDKGAFTGELSGSLIKEAGADYVIIGHSERRQYFGETNQSVNQKTKAAFKHDLIPIVCVGETLEEREAGLVDQVISTQINESLEGLTPYEAKDIVVAYEPVWAIGTGKTATPAQVEEVHSSIRFLLANSFGSDVADQIRIQYGGSMKPGNAKELLALPNVDGGLIGGAALKPSDFIAIITSA